MCNLYRMTKGTDEVAKLFDAIPDSGANFGEEVYPGYPGLVIAQGKAQAMTWGFPLVLRGKQGQMLKPRPVNNAREDKLMSAFWKDSFAQRRCLIPVSAWAEAQGPKGSKTRTWYALPDGEPFAVAGVWRPTHEWGNAYAMVMVDSCAQIADDHSRMPLIVQREYWQEWTSGEPEAARNLCRPWGRELTVDRTSQAWVRDRAKPKQVKLL